ncbi:YybH family protein [Burkholderia lata]|uniref:YybH family protein n=1 Tax=Burkholderia lata (strain ATCC 17760 / DSM 23089 / LMG 22485 / NCIMB 9086 / R18194 / 383) TaxID=482957 RepID=UPI0015824B2D|nr:nuclear transport factor 2 family protein [Burkholderia lata]
MTREQIEQIYKELQPHFVRTADIDGYAEMFTSDGVWWPLGRATRIGPRQIRDGFAELTRGCRFEPVFEATQIHVSGQVGSAALLGTITIMFDNGDPTQVVRSREIWEFREEDGVTKISRMIWNQVPS